MRVAIADFLRRLVLSTEAGAIASALSGFRVGMSGLRRAHRTGLLHGLIILLVAIPAWSEEDEGGRTFYQLAIPAGPAAERLRRFAEQSGYQLLYRSDWVVGLETNAVNGRYRIDRALELLLRDTGLEATTTREGVITLVVDNKSSDEGNSMGSDSRGFSLKRIAAGIASMFAAAGSVPAAAQQSAVVLEEVIVTAQKQSESLRNVAMTVNAISGREFADSASFEFTDIDRLTAGLDVRGDSFDTDIVLRGVGTNLSAPVSPRVTTYVDGAHVSAVGGLYVAQYDLSNFEVLRGSQGTLYGQASPAGAITIQTADPSLREMDGYIKQSLFERDGTNTQFGMSVPVVENVFALRVSGVYDYNRNADISNRYLGEDASKQTQSGRLVMLFQPTDYFRSRLLYQNTEYSQDYFEVLDGDGPIGRFDYRDRDSAGNVDGRVDIDDQHVIWENTIDLGNHQLTSISFYQEQSTLRLDDRDITPAEVDRQRVDSNYSGIWRQELRLGTSDNAFWNYMLGVYYSESSTATEVDRLRGGGSQIIDIGIDSESEDWGIFAHNTFDLTADTKLTAGVRWIREESFNLTQMRVQVPAFNVEINSIIEAPEDQRRTFEAWTGTLKLQHDINDSVMVYASYDRGFRAGSVNVSTGTFPAQFAVFDEETSHSFELGLKSRFLDGAGELMATMYYQVYEDFQNQADNIPVCEEVAGGICDEVTDFSAVVLADEVISQGAEVELRLLPTENWSLSGSVSYNDTYFESFKDAPCDTGSVPARQHGFATCDLSGESLGAAPTWSAVASSEYSVPIGIFGGSEWFLRGLYNFTGSVDDPVTDVHLGSFGMWDLFTGLRGPGGRWEVSLWAKNAFDKDALLDSSFVSAFPDNYRAVRVTDPRTLGMSASYRW